MTRSFVLSLVCKDRPGIVAAVTQSLLQAGANITEAGQFEDHSTGQFFMRIVFDAENSKYWTSELDSLFESPTRTFEMDWKLRPFDQKKKVLILVSKQDHCLADLLYRTSIGELHMDVVGIVSNHPREPSRAAPIEEIPYHYLPVTAESKLQQEAHIKRIVEETGAELVILARYMRILSNDLVSHLWGRCVNIHHSFLPGFKGARPYHQAFERGVKLIGATAHFVTSDLDEGPIIEQNVEPVTHADSPEDMVRKGRDVERRVLAMAVRQLLQDRVLINGRKTVVFRS